MNRILQFFYETTMYRLMMYFMVVLLGWAILASAFGVLSYSAWDIFLQTMLFVVLCQGFNTIITRFLGIKPNPESSIITGLILSAIMGPLSLQEEWLWIVVASAAAIASKYILVTRSSHIFNPAAFGAVAVGLLGYSASWWIGNSVTFPLMLIGGLLIAHKIRRLHLVVTFLLVYTCLLVLDIFLVRGDGLSSVATLLDALFMSSPILFFAFVMLVEPLTSPQTKRKRVYFGAFVGAALFLPQWFLSQVPFSLELALLAGNLFSRIISPDFRQTLILHGKETLSPGIQGFWFEPVRPFPFISGQYLEYTLAHPRADSRGVRRYFTIASAPRDMQILLATRFSKHGSSFKRALREMEKGDEIIASKVAGDFVLPANIKRKLVFIAGGIGITPFRSIARHLLEHDEHRDIVLLYAAREERDLVFRDVFEEARKIGMRNVYILSEAEKVPASWNGKIGRLDATIIKTEVPDAKERTFYISGPEPMVKGIFDLLLDMDIPQKQILRDYFPGYA